MKIFWIAVASLAAIGAIVIAVLLIAPKSPIPGPIKNQVTSTILVPQGRHAVIDRNSVKYNSSEKLLTFTAKAYNTNIVFSQQPTPDTFNNGLSSYDLFIKNMDKYSNFDVDAGTVYLTRPPQQQNHQVGIINAKGTLLFAKPSKDLRDSQWRQLFTSLEPLH